MKLNANKFTGGAYFLIDKKTDAIVGEWKALGTAVKHWKVGYQRNPDLVVVPVADAQLFLLKRGY